MPVDHDLVHALVARLNSSSSPGAALALSQIRERYGALLQPEGVRVTKQCDHDEANVEILSVTPAAAGWGYAILTSGAVGEPDLEIEPVVAWALVRHDDDCACPRTMVVPLVAGRERLSLELPYKRESTSVRLIRPGERPVVEKWTGGRSYLGSRAGVWEPGAQDPAEAAE